MQVFHLFVITLELEDKNQNQNEELTTVRCLYLSAILTKNLKHSIRQLH